MFRIKADCREEIEARVSQQDAYEWFRDHRNFVALLPSLESVTPERDGSLCWMLRADVPGIGVMRVPFRVTCTDAPPIRIEYAPALIERQNYLRCVASFTAIAPALTLIKITQTLDLRRSNAKFLHVMAAVVGEARISAETQKQMALRLREFLQAARKQLETPPAP
jgi:hypothetical protein